MWVVSKKALRQFWEIRPEAQSSLEEWYHAVRHVTWENYAEVRATFNSVDIYQRCHIFNVGGNKYRVIAAIHFNTHKVFIRQVLTHAEYDRGKWKSNCHSD